MKKLSLIVVFLLLNFSVRAQDSENTQVEESDYYAMMEFDFDFDIFRTKETAKILNTISDKFWRFLGYDSNAFVSAKQILRDPARRIELALSLVAIDKFPECENAVDCLDMLLSDVLFENILSKELHDKLTSIGYSKRFGTVHDVVSSLSDDERITIAANMQEDEPLISLDGLLTTLSDDEVGVLSACLKLKIYDLLNKF